MPRPLAADRPRRTRWRFWHNFLVGIPWENWRTLRAVNRVDAGYRHRAAYLTAMSLLNSFYRRREEQRFGTAIAKTRFAGPPLFILGHWRTGTTLLHDLIARDTVQFATPNSAQVTYPYTFLCTEEILRRRSGGLLPPTRPQDNVAIGMGTPQEEEFALCVASLKSPYLGMFSFPRRAGQYERYLTLRDVSPEEVDAWTATFRWFAQKLTLKYGRPLLLKSPTHTARIGRILQIFPDARFVHIHRDPYVVFQSTRHLLATLPPLYRFQWSPGDQDASILERYTRLFDAYFEERSQIPAGRLLEVRFEDLELDPVGQVRALYDGLGLPGFEAFRPRLQAYVESLSGYRKTEHLALSPDFRRRVASAWQRSFDAWGYPA